MILIHISIHTPVKGVTVSVDDINLAFLDFNPHTREGCDVPVEEIARMVVEISIHTPVKGVTAEW